MSHISYNYISVLKTKYVIYHLNGNHGSCVATLSFRCYLTFTLSLTIKQFPPIIFD